MKAGDWTTLTRDCDALLIPSAEPIKLSAGDEVQITQTLGDVYTVFANGCLVRIANKDADALGIEVVEPSSETMQPSQQTGPFGPVDIALVWEQLKTCYDPEIPVNVVDLGLIYDCQVISLADDEEATNEKGNRVEITMTLTAPGCAMGPVLQSDIDAKVRTVSNVTEVQVYLVFDPPWNVSMMSEAARLELGMI